MIHVSFALSDKDGGYSKYLGTAICSLLENTKESINIHLLHDHTLTEENRSHFSALVRAYQQRLFFYPVELHDLPNVDFLHDFLRKFSMSAFFRWTLPEVLPKEIRKVIYFDADTLFYLDIQELWDIPLDGYRIAACRHPKETNQEAEHTVLCRHHLLTPSEYFNSGVLVFDLAAIREHIHLYEEGIDFLAHYPDSDLMDQDALNFIFHHRVFYLPYRFNQFTRVIRGQNFRLKPCIYHFSGDYVNFEEPEEFDRLFLQYFLRTPWGNRHGVYGLFSAYCQRYASRIKAYQNLVRCLSRQGTKKIIFGAKGLLHEAILQLVVLQPGDYYVDNDVQWHGKSMDEFPVYPVNKIAEEQRGTFIVVVCSKNKYPIIKQQLETYGLRECVDFFDGRLLLLQNQGGYASYG